MYRIQEEILLHMLSCLSQQLQHSEAYEEISLTEGGKHLGPTQSEGGFREIQARLDYF